MDRYKAEELLYFQVKRNVTNLYKGFLVILEDVQQQHSVHFNKLKRALPEHQSVINQADYLDEANLDYMRKKVLDLGNDCRRQLETELDKFDIDFDLDR